MTDMISRAQTEAGGALSQLAESVRVIRRLCTGSTAKQSEGRLLKERAERERKQTRTRGVSVRRSGGSVEEVGGEQNKEYVGCNTMAAWDSEFVAYEWRYCALKNHKENGFGRHCCRRISENSATIRVIVVGIRAER